MLQDGIVEGSCVSYGVPQFFELFLSTFSLCCTAFCRGSCRLQLLLQLHNLLSMLLSAAKTYFLESLSRCVDKSCRTCQLANVYLGGLTDVCTTNVSHWIAPSEGAEQKGLLSPQTSLRLQKTRVFRPGLLEIVSSFQAACSARNFSFQLSSDGLGPAELLLQGFMLFHGFCRGLRKRQGRTLVVFSRARLCLLQRFLRAVSEHDGLVR